MPYNLTQFQRSPEDVMRQAYLTLADWDMGDDERRRLAITTSHMRGLYDLFRFVETELECTRLTLDHIEERLHALSAGEIEPSDLQSLADEFTDWIDASYNWRSDKRFGVSTKDIAKLDDGWTKKITPHREKPVLNFKPMTRKDISSHIEK